MDIDMMKFDASAVQKLMPGQKITVPGFYELPLESHHSQPCEGISVTSSTLRDLWLHGPEYVWAFSKMNPERMERPETDALRIGRAMAAIVEGGVEQLEKMFQVLPDSRPNRPTSKQLDAWDRGTASEAAIRSIKFWRDVDADKRDILTPHEFEQLAFMGGRLARDPMAQACLTGLPEVTMAWWDSVNEIWVLSRPDVISFDGICSDYKKINTGGRPMRPGMIDKKIETYRYDMQIGLGVEAFEMLTGQFIETAGLVFQMDTPPYSPVIRGFEVQDIEIGILECRRMRELFRKCLDEGHWPGPGEDVGNYRRSQWLTKFYEENTNE